MSDPVRIVKRPEGYLEMRVYTGGIGADMVFIAKRKEEFANIAKAIAEAVGAFKEEPRLSRGDASCDFCGRFGPVVYDEDRNNEANRTAWVCLACAKRIVKRFEG